MQRNSTTIRVPNSLIPYVRQLIYLHQIEQSQAALEQIRKADNCQEAIAELSREAAIA
jgi:hypothetical protein